MPLGGDSTKRLFTWQACEVAVDFTRLGQHNQAGCGGVSRMAKEINVDMTVETDPTLPHATVGRTSGQSCLVQIYPVEPAVGNRHVLKQVPLVLGRDDSCDILIAD